MLLVAGASMPAEALAPECTKRAFISGLLARNEIDRDDAYQRRLLKAAVDGTVPIQSTTGAGNDGWLPVFAVLNIALVEETAEPRHARHIDTLLGLAGVAPAAEAMASAHSGATDVRVDAVRHKDKRQARTVKRRASVDHPG